MAGGRPTKFTNALSEKICFRLAEGESLLSICKSPDMPHRSTIMRWLLSDSPVYKSFCDNYAKAREIQYQCMADEIMDIADDGTNDYMLRHDGENEAYVVNGEAVARSRIRVDTRKWFMSKVLPKFYDKREESKSTDSIAESLSKLIDKFPS